MYMRMSDRINDLKSFANDRFLRNFMEILFIFRVYAGKLLRRSSRRNIFSKYVLLELSDLAKHMYFSNHMYIHISLLISACFIHCERYYSQPSNRKCVSFVRRDIYSM